MKKFSLFDVGFLLGLFAFVLFVAKSGFASVPPLGRVTDDTAVYQNLSEISAPRQGKISFDADIQRLNQMEPKFHERLPRMADRPGIAGPMRRISAKKYKPSHHGKKLARRVQD
jgi:hypothetical protein